jgi:hypothetical protein
MAIVQGADSVPEVRFLSFSPAKVVSRFEAVKVTVRVGENDQYTCVSTHVLHRALASCSDIPLIIVFRRINCKSDLPVSWLLSELIRQFTSRHKTDDPGFESLENTTTNQTLSLTDEISGCAKTG